MECPTSYSFENGICPQFNRFDKIRMLDSAELWIVSAMNVTGVTRFLELHETICDIYVCYIVLYCENIHTFTQWLDTFLNILFNSLAYERFEWKFNK